MGAVYFAVFDCTLTDGTPYRLAVRRGSTDREVHEDDADRLLALFSANRDLAEANWLTAMMITIPVPTLPTSSTEPQEPTDAL